MKRISIFCLIFLMVTTFGLSGAFAGPAAKATAQLGDLSVLDVSGSSQGQGQANTGWQTLFTQKIKIPQDKDLFIDVSLECGLTTDTTVMSKKLARAVAYAEAIIEVQVLLDGKPVPVNGNTADGTPAPDTDITFARRSQELVAQFAGDISDCLSVNGDGNIVVDWTCVDPETLQLILDTMQANSFNFIVPDLNAGEHTVKIQAKLSYVATNKTDQGIINDGLAQGIAFARAYLGNGSVTVETVRMIKGEDVIVDLE